MMKPMLRPWIALAAAAAAITMVGGAIVSGQKQEDFRFRSGVELVNVTATVVDKTGRFVPGLKQEDFVIYEENVQQEVSHFSNERVPVSLGIVLDTSGSMTGEKLEYAQSAINRFLTELLDPQDEIFLIRFQSYPDLLQDWTVDRTRLSRVVSRLNAGGGTAMYDAVAEAVPIAQTGEHRKKAILLISDGNDTDSDSSVGQVKQLIRNSEVLVYAIGIDGQAESTFGMPNPPIGRPRMPLPPMPVPGGRRPGGGGVILPQLQWPPQSGGGRTRTVRVLGDRVDVNALRELTDDSGGRTEIVRSGRDLDPATANIADELSRQYYLGYSSTGKKDGKWHAIRVEVRDPSLRVRARRGFIATP
ncbi:MAG: VWA domain-containing protein [Vicinamibacterales bacterium]|nr:VWA domain-containing protein [Vicinamibacterales bacterium]